MGRIRIYPWKSPSASAEALRDAFQSLGQDALLIRREGSRYTPRDTDFVINWGSTDVLPYETVNSAAAVNIATNKRATLERLSAENVSCVDFVTNIHAANDWRQAGVPLYARTRLRASQGDGIVYVPDSDSYLPEARLYTKAEVGKEYRVHVMIDADGEGHMVRCQKRFKEDDDHPVRSHNNGYRFITQNFRRPNHIGKLAIAAIKAVGLKFGAVDIINARDPLTGERTLKVLEINTACGLEGSSPTELAQAFLDHLAPPEPELPEVEPYTFDPDTEVKLVRSDAA